MIALLSRTLCKLPKENWNRSWLWINFCVQTRVHPWKDPTMNETRMQYMIKWLICIHLLSHLTSDIQFLCDFSYKLNNYLDILLCFTSAQNFVEFMKPIDGKCLLTMPCTINCALSIAKLPLRWEWSLG